MHLTKIFNLCKGCTTSEVLPADSVLDESGKTEK